MATVTCPRCSAKVNSDLMACPQCGLSRRQDLSKKIVTIALIPFNIFLAVWLISSLHLVSRSLGAENMIIEQQGDAFPIWLIIAIWVIGDILLLGHLWLKRDKKNKPAG